ncbi:hypothetical protein BJY01DRAFT_239506 [Aspergillus pseudoustus]|uniref:Uncharacterized protein n=1 Tax=Aspergillus pseudoustus TaxID=1810923 RepID=A0ABR4J097_9EURO
MRYLYALTLLPLALPAVVYGEAKDPLDVLGNIEALSNLKQFVSLASSLSSLVDNTDNNKEESEDSDPLDPNRKADVLSQIQHVAGLASTLLDLASERDPATSEKLEGVRNTNGDTAVDRDQIDILGGIKALQQFASLAGGIGSLLDVSSLAQEEKKGPVKVDRAGETPRQAPPKAKKQPTSRKPTAQKTPKKSVPPPVKEPVDFIARLDAIKMVTTLASKLSGLTDPNSEASPIERVQNLMNDPDVRDAFHYIYTNAHKVFTPEMLEAAKAFIRTSNLIPPEYREIAIAVLEALSAVFSPQFARDFQQALGTITQVGIDLGPWLATGFDLLQWALKTFDADYIAWMNREVGIWQRAITSPQMGMLTAYLTDPETLAGVTASVERVKKALTAERIHRLHALFEEAGIFDLEDGEYVEFGGHLGARFRGQFTTEQGLAELKHFLDALEELLRTGTLDVAARAMQMRAPVVAPALAGDIHSIYVQSGVVVDILAQLAEALQGFVEVMHPLLEFEVRAAKVTSWEFWAELNSVVEKFSATPVTSLGAVHELLVMLSRVLEPEHVPGLRLLILDCGRTLAEPHVLGSVPANVPGNVTGIFMSTEVEMLGLVESAPVLEAEHLEHVLALLHRFDAVLGPGQDEAVRVRQTIVLLNKVSSFVVQILQVFDSQDNHRDEL